jgi:hypothetical protein
MAPGCQYAPKLGTRNDRDPIKINADVRQSTMKFDRACNARKQKAMQGLVIRVLVYWLLFNFALLDFDVVLVLALPGR